jgi:TonB family protein
MQVPENVEFVRSRVTEALGEKVQTVGRRFGLEGTVLLGLVVGSAGRTQDTRILESSGYSLLDREAIDILRGALFTPARLNQRNVAECTVMHITFEVR